MHARNFFNATKFLAFGAFITTALQVLAVNPPPIQTYYVPLEEHQLYAALVTLGYPASSNLHSVVSIAANSSNTLIYYDHWEDGFEADLANPVQPTTEIWGDGNVGNGIPPGFAVDRINAGSVLTLASDFIVPHSVSNMVFDGRDKIGATKPIAVSYSCWPNNTGPVLADGSEVYDTTVYGTNFYAPIGVNVAVSQIFSYSSLYVMAAQDNTVVTIDRDGNGSADVVTNLQEGMSYHVDGGVHAGARITSSDPVQVHMVTGEIKKQYSMRWFTLYAQELWSDAYYSPVGLTANKVPVGAYLHNQNAVPIVVRCTRQGGTSYITVPSKGTALYTVPVNSGVQFVSTNGLEFTGVVAMDVQKGGRSYDWGATMTPVQKLTPELLVGWGPGSSDLSRNGSPVWITPVSNTVLFVDYDGDPATGAHVDHTGRRYDTSYAVTALESRRIFDNSDNDQTGMRVYTTNNVNIAGMWGEDPATASSGNPYLDIGTAILPIPSYSGFKTSVVTNDLNHNGRLDPGETALYTIRLNNEGVVGIENIVVNDRAEGYATYVANSTRTNGASVADNIPPATPFPLDGAGLNCGLLKPGASLEIEYKMTVTNPYPLTTQGITNSAHFTTTGSGSFTFKKITLCEQSDLALALGVNNSTPAVGGPVVFTLAVTNKGPFAATGVAVRDVLPAGLTYQSHSGGTYIPTSGVWSVGSVPVGARATLQITATAANLNCLTNVAEISAADQFDPNSTPNNGNPSEDDWAKVIVCPVGPYVDITSTVSLVTYDTVTLAVAGTNNTLVVGRMWVTNATAGGAALGFNAATGWTAPAIPLNVGANTIRVFGTNTQGVVATDHTTITRGGIGTGQPFVDVTNAPATVTYDVVSYAVAGTNNIHVMGGMTVSNKANGATFNFPANASWTTPVLPLAVGANQIVVVGTNYLNVVVSDSVTITRGGIGTGQPFVDVTNAPATVTYDVASYAVAGTNNIHVMGGMTVSNKANGATFNFPASASWTTPVLPLAVGANQIVVVGTNYLNVVVSDSVTITRGGIGTGQPFVDVTNAPATVTYDVVSYAVAGTNNIHVMGGMTVSNKANGATFNFPASASWTTPVLPLAVGANQIVVVGTNYLNVVVSDSVTITRGGIGTGQPFVDVTNAPATVTYDVVSYAVAGTNNIHVMGGMTVSNKANGATFNFPASASWTTPVLPLAVGANQIVVVGTNYLNVVVSDSVTITRGGIGTGQPFVDVTNAPATVTYDVVSYAVAGTNNIHVMGGMTVSNKANGATFNFPASASWTTPVLPLAVGANQIVVVGTNYLNVVVSDSVTITRGGIGTGQPFVDVTNAPATVTYDVASYAVAGTNNIHVMGGMTVSNKANGATFNFPASASWTTPVLPLAVGANQIVVVGTNYLNVVVSDSVTITRGGIGTGQPFVDVTNAPATVTYDVASYAVAGTNNIHVMGGMTVSNKANGATFNFPASASWTTPVLPLAVGANQIVVVGTNYLNVVVSDSVTITRGGIGTGQPFVDVTNAPATVTYDVASYAVAGTNNIHVMGGMTVSNKANGATFNFPASASWTTPVLPLAVGANQIVVVGTNYLNVVVSDSVTITRGGIGTGQPFVDVTNAPATVTYDVASYAVAGTNNIHVMGGMTVSNKANGATFNFPASASWTTPVLPLAVGANQIVVVGTNYLNVVVSDSVTITRGGVGAGEPFVDITNDSLFVTYDTKSHAVAGTNNMHVVGGMTAINLANNTTADFDAAEFWLTPALPLAIGANTIFVTGTNYLNRSASDYVTITRGCIGTGQPFVDITNDAVIVTYDVTSYAVAGTNNIHVMGDMVVSNMANGATYTFSSSAAWTTPALPLEIGANQIVVVGANQLDVTASDSVTIFRGGIGTGQPFTDITNEPVFVTFDSSEYAVAGTNNIHVIGGMRLHNDANGATVNFPAATAWATPVVPLEVGVNTLTVFGSNLLNIVVSDTVTITRGAPGTGQPFMAVTTTPTLVEVSVTNYVIAGTNNLNVVGGMLVSNAANGVQAVFDAALDWQTPALSLVVGRNEFHAYGTNAYGVLVHDTVVITRGALGDILNLWPHLIGATQTGTIEFTALETAPYEILAVQPDGGTQSLGSGVCTQGWNLVPFYGGDLPLQLAQGTNALFLRIKDELPIPVGEVAVVNDLTPTARSWFTLENGDLVRVKYKPRGAGNITAQGRTLYIHGGGNGDKLIINAKRNRKVRTSDGLPVFEGIISDGGFRLLNVQGAVQRLLVAQQVRNAKFRNGALGQNSLTKLHDVRFNAVRGRTTLNVQFGDLRGNLLIGTVSNAPSFDGFTWTGGTVPEHVATREGMNNLMVLGGNLGLNSTTRWCNAEFFKRIAVKARKKRGKRFGGEIVDYNLFLTGEERAGKGRSIRVLQADFMYDSENVEGDMVVACGIDPSIDPLSVTDWHKVTVSKRIETLVLRNGVVGTTFVMNVPPKRTKINGSDRAFWIYPSD